MKRLTKHANGEIDFANKNVGLYEVLERLAEYEDINEQNRLVVLPLNIGDYVYHALDNGIIEKWKVIGFTIYYKDIIVEVVEMVNGKSSNISKCFRADKIGRNVFTTYLEAESKIK